MCPRGWICSALAVLLTLNSAPAVAQDANSPEELKRPHEEAIAQLSLVRLGVQIGLVSGVAVQAVTQLFLLTQPAHLPDQASSANVVAYELPALSVSVLVPQP